MAGIKNCFISRYSDGVVCEADFSQIEVVVQAYLTGDAQMKQDVRDGVDFHCKRLAAKLGEDYDYVYKMCHVTEDPTYKKMRSAIKPVVFKKNYGGGVRGIAEDEGMTVAEVQAMFDAEHLLYPKIKETQEAWIKAVQDSKVLTNRKSFRGYPVGRGYMTTFSGKRYVFFEEDLPASLQKIRDARGFVIGRKHVGFKPTAIKNFAVQGTAGEILHLVLGKLYRFFRTPEVRDVAKLINTIHDSVYFDFKDEETMHKLLSKIKQIMEGGAEYMEEYFGIDFDLPLRVEFKAGKTWGTMQSIQVSS